MKPTRIEFDLGPNIHGQPLRLVKGRTSANQEEWTLFRDAAHQRDDATQVGGLTDQLIRAMFQAVEEVRLK